MRILITAIQFTARTGSELYSFDLAVQLARLGHHPAVYSPTLGPIAQQLRERSIPVVDDLRHIAQCPDIVHGQHNVPTIAAISHFSSCPAVQVVHDCSAWHDRPVIHPRLLRYIAVDNACRERLLHSEGVRADRIAVHPNGIDLQRFAMRETCRETPKRALLLSNYADAVTARTIEVACRARGMELLVGGKRLGGVTDRPEQLMQQADIVFAKGRTAWEALATGAAVVACDSGYMGEMVLPENLAAMQPWNFGRRLLLTPVTSEAIACQIDRYDACGIRQVSQRIRNTMSVEQVVAGLVDIYGDVIERHRAHHTDPVREGECMAEFLQWLSAHHRDLARELVARRRIGSLVARWSRGLTRLCLRPWLKLARPTPQSTPQSTTLPTPQSTPAHI